MTSSPLLYAYHAAVSSNRDARDLADVERLRVDVEHAEDPRRVLAGAWLLSVATRDTHPVDAFYWMNEAKLWAQGEQADPRLDAFADAWREATQALPPVQPRSKKCKCPTCRPR